MNGWGLAAANPAWSELSGLSQLRHKLELLWKDPLLRSVAYDAIGPYPKFTSFTSPATPWE